MASIREDFGVIKKIIRALTVVVFLNAGLALAMERENTNPATVARIAEIIMDLGLQADNEESMDILFDALQGQRVSNQEITEAFKKVQSQGKPMPQEQKAIGKLGRELTATEKENAYKMWLMQQAMQGTEVPQDVQGVIGQTLNQLSANPVLDGTLQYTMDNGQTRLFKIRDLVKKDGSIDLSNPVFGDASKFLLITTDPEQFFRVDEGSGRLVILIAPKFLIEEKIGSSAAPFAPIMTQWIGDQAPIGIFYRMEYWKNLNWYDYLTSADLFTISKYNLFDNWDQYARHEPIHWNNVKIYAEKFMFIFNKR